MALALPFSPDKAQNWDNLIDSAILEGHISNATLEAPIGRLGLAKTAVFVRFARAMVKPLYAKIYSRRFRPSMASALLRNLRRWEVTIERIRPRGITFERQMPGWILYTDAALEPGPAGAKIAAIFPRV